MVMQLELFFLWLQSVEYKSTGNSYTSRSEYVTYSTGSWTNPFEDKSGAYIFMPSGAAQSMMRDVTNVVVLRGSLLSSVESQNHIATQRATVYNVTGPLSNAVYVENWVDLRGVNNTELAMRIHTDIEQIGEPQFYTDNNAFQVCDVITRFFFEVLL